jgi:hypothetical protein
MWDFLLSSSSEKKSDLAVVATKSHKKTAEGEDRALYSSSIHATYIFRYIFHYIAGQIPPEFGRVIHKTLVIA